MRCLYGYIFVWLIMLAAPGFAAPDLIDVDARLTTGLKSPNDAAVVISIEKYSNLGAGAAVPFASRDGDGMEEFFLYTRGMSSQKVQRIENNMATVSGIETAYKKALRQAEGGTVWFYFAGHGFASSEDSGQMLMTSKVSIDDDLAETMRNSVALSKLMDWANRSKVQNAVFIIDACNVPLQRFVVPVELALKPVAQKTTLVWTAASKGQVSGPYQAAEHGAFTYAVLAALRGAADGEKDTQRDFDIDAEEAELYVKRFFRTHKKELPSQNPLMIASGAFSFGKYTNESPKPVAAVLPQAQAGRMGNSSSATVDTSATFYSEPSARRKGWDLRLSLATALLSNERFFEGSPQTDGYDYEGKTHFSNPFQLDVAFGHRWSRFGLYLDASYALINESVSITGERSNGEISQEDKKTTHALGLGFLGRFDILRVKKFTLSAQFGMAFSKVLDTSENLYGQGGQGSAYNYDDFADCFPNQNAFMSSYKLGTAFEYALSRKISANLGLNLQTLNPVDDFAALFQVHTVLFQIGMGMGYRF